MTPQAIVNEWDLCLFGPTDMFATCSLFVCLFLYISF